MAAILGISPWQSPWDVWLAKTQGVADAEPSAAMEAGRRLEPAILAWAADVVGHQVLPHDTLAERGWMRASIDGALDSDPVLYVEVKTTDRFDQAWGPDGGCRIPAHYESQARWYMAVLDVDQYLVAAFAHWTRDLRVYTLHRDVDLERTLVSRCGSWWETHVVVGEEPALDGSSAAAGWLRKQHPEHNSLWLEPGGDTTVDAYKDAHTRSEAASAEMRELAAQIKRRIGDHKGMRGPWGFIRWDRFGRRRINWRELHKEHPEVQQIMDEYTTVEPSGRLVAKWEDE